MVPPDRLFLGICHRGLPLIPAIWLCLEIGVLPRAVGEAALFEWEGRGLWLDKLKWTASFGLEKGKGILWLWKLVFFLWILIDCLLLFFVFAFFICVLLLCFFGFFCFCLFYFIFFCDNESTILSVWWDLWHTLFLTSVNSAHWF